LRLVELVTNSAAPPEPPRFVPVRVEAGPAFELLATLWAFLHGSHHPYYDVGRSWFDRIAADAPETAARARAFAGASLMVWDHVLGLALDGGAPYEVDHLLAQLESADPDTLRLALLGRWNRPVQRAVGAERIEEAAAGNATAQRDFMRLAWPDESPWQAGLRQLFRHDPAETRAELVAVLRAWDRDVFAPYIGPVQAALEADAEAKRASAATLPAPELIRSALDTAYTPTGDVAGVVLVPSFVIRPFVYFIEHADQMLFLYPVGDRTAETVDPGPPERLVKLAQALGDRGRLEILGILRERDMAVREIATELGLARSTLRHHLGILQGAGLIRPIQSGTGFSRFQLREEAATDLAELLDRFLRRSPA
jgi:DNA-binding transcriptional ArsR family regulator